jgi:hypothetical protein
LGDWPIALPEGENLPLAISSGCIGQPGGEAMRKGKKTGRKLPEKTYWHLYSLQSLNPEKFVKVVDKILKNYFVLIK